MKNTEFNALISDNQDKIICHCRNVTQNEIEIAIQMGAKTLSEIQKITGACTGNQCKVFNPSGKCCSGDILGLLKTFDI
jgi:NAD(P)H-nitrite reductase large subunit